MAQRQKVHQRMNPPDFEAPHFHTVTFKSLAQARFITNLFLRVIYFQCPPRPDGYDFNEIDLVPLTLPRWWAQPVDYELVDEMFCIWCACVRPATNGLWSLFGKAKICATALATDCEMNMALCAPECFHLCRGADLEQIKPNAQRKSVGVLAKVIYALGNYRDPRPYLPDNDSIVQAGLTVYLHAPSLNSGTLSSAVTPPNLTSADDGKSWSLTA